MGRPCKIRYDWEYLIPDKSQWDMATRLAVLLQRERKKTGDSMFELAAKLDVSGPAVQNWESKKGSTVELHNIEKIAKGLGWNTVELMKYLYYGDNPPEPNHEVQDPLQVATRLLDLMTVTELSELSGIIADKLTTRLKVISLEGFQDKRTIIKKDPKRKSDNGSDKKN